jgi:hypothetical protein
MYRLPSRKSQIKYIKPYLISDLDKPRAEFPEKQFKIKQSCGTAGGSGDIAIMPIPGQ